MNSQLTNEGRSSSSQATSESACGTSPRNINVIPFRVRAVSPRTQVAQHARHRYGYTVPLPKNREEIYHRFRFGQSERQIAKNMGIPDTQVRLVLQCYAEIRERQLASRRSADRALRVADAEIAASVWQEAESGHFPPTGAPARRVA